MYKRRTCDICCPTRSRLPIEKRGVVLCGAATTDRSSAGMQQTPNALRNTRPNAPRNSQEARELHPKSPSQAHRPATGATCCFNFRNGEGPPSALPRPPRHIAAPAPAVRPSTASAPSLPTLHFGPRIPQGPRRAQTGGYHGGGPAARRRGRRATPTRVRSRARALLLQLPQRCARVASIARHNVGRAHSSRALEATIGTSTHAPGNPVGLPSGGIRMIGRVARSRLQVDVFGARKIFQDIPNRSGWAQLAGSSRGCY